MINFSIRTAGFIIAFSILNVAADAQTLQSVTDQGNVTTNSIEIGGQSVNANTTKLFLNNPFGKKFAISAGANMITENGLHIYNWTDNPARPLLSLTNEGNFGIGNFTPEAKLHIQADANTSGAPYNAQLLISGNTSPGKRLSLAYNTSSNYAEMQSQAYAGAYTPLIFNPNGGNVGIGITNPQKALDVAGGAVISGSGNTLTLRKPDNNTPAIAFEGLNGSSVIEGGDDKIYAWVGGDYRLAIKKSGNIGIGTVNPRSMLQIGEFNSSIDSKLLLIPGVYNFERLQIGQLSNGNAAFEMVNHNSHESAYGVRLMANIDKGGPGLQFQYAQATNSYETLNYQTGMFLDLNGRIGIGTLSPRETLSVNGKIRAHEIKVEIINWPDYVFSKAYALPDLKETENFIQKKGHLPDMPSAKEIENNGLALGEMLKLQQKKIEELTLHLIRLNKEVEKLKSKKHK